MFTLYTYATPNGQKASIMLEEVGLPYTVSEVDLAKGEQRQSGFLNISPLGTIPALVEATEKGPPRHIFGSGAILMYLAQRAGKFLPQDPVDQAQTLNWLMIGLTDLSPAAISFLRFNARAPEKIPYAIDLFKNELVRCYRALEIRLAGNSYLGGVEYSIADMAVYPFISIAQKMTPNFGSDYPHLCRWYQTVGQRPAVQKGMAIPAS